MVTQTLALLLDSYRELNSKKMFWISMILSGVVVAAFATVGLQNGSLYFLWIKTPLHFDILSMFNASTFYKTLFVTLGIRYWLTLFASVLALVSTAGIFPDLIASGSIDLYLSKPISRLRLFVIKYLGGLLFAGMQVTVFTIGSFLLLGFRGHSWEPSLFVAIPLVVLIYSYLFCVCVLLGVLTRSTIASLLLTLLLWFALWGVKVAEEITQGLMIHNDLHVAILERQIPIAESKLSGMPVSTAPAATAPVVIEGPPREQSSSFFSFLGRGKPETKEELAARLTTMRVDLDESKDSSLRTIHNCVFAVMAPLPKTDGTTDLLERYLIKSADLPDSQAPAGSLNNDSGMDGHGRYEPTGKALAKAIEAENSKRTGTWTVGSSLAFELVICTWAAWVFCRRDY